MEFDRMGYALAKIHRAKIRAGCTAANPAFEARLWLTDDKRGGISIYGQECNATTRRLPVTNLANRPFNDTESSPSFPLSLIPQVDKRIDPKPTYPNPNQP